MNKIFKSIMLSPLFFILLVACHPSIDESSLSSEGESSEISSQDSSFPPHEHQASEEWEYDEDHHWHPCKICGEHMNVDHHYFDEGVIIIEPTSTEAGITRYTCTVCGHYYDEIIPMGDELDKMNEAIENESFIDPYEVRDYLINKGYHFLNQLPEGKRYGYVEELNKVVIYKDNEIIRPTEAIGKEFFPYNKISVSSFNSLALTIDRLNKEEINYNTVELNNDIEQLSSSPLIKYLSSSDLEIDLNHHSILANEIVDKDYKNEKWFTLQFNDDSNSSRIYIHNGTIEANRKMKTTGVEDDSCCVSLVKAKSFRLNNLSLKAKNGSQCIGDMSEDISYWHDKNKKVYISNVAMEASLRAMSIAGGIWDIRDSNSIKGMVCIDGGKVDFNNVTIDASNAYIVGLNDYSIGFSNAQLMYQEVTRVNDEEVISDVYHVITSYRGAMNFNDAINVLSRRLSIYSPAIVTVNNSSLTPVIVNDVVTGYGFRYWDLGNTASGEAVEPQLTNCQFPRFDSETGFGGSNLG